MTKRYLLARHVAVAALFAFTLALAMPSTAAETVVFDNGNPDLEQMYASDPNTGVFQAQDFTFTGATTFNTVRWFGVYGPDKTPTAPDAFTISFFDTTAGTPNATPRIGEVFAVGNPGRMDTGSNIFGSFDVYQYEATLASPVTMGAGTFGISIVNDTTADTNDDWLWPSSAQTGTRFFRTTPTGAFSNSTRELAFQLINNVVVVPETGTLALVFPALALVGAVVV